VSVPVRIRRKDASERRERLIAAAVDLFGIEGFDVPLEKIASRAGVSRPTLYRNFPDRETVIAVVQQVHLDRIQELVAQWADRNDAFLLAVHMMAERTLNSGGLEKLLASRNSPEAHTEVFVSGMTKILSGPLERAKAAGLVRRDFDIDQVGMLILMLSGGALARNNADRPALDLAVNLIVTGLAPRSALVPANLGSD
jgi:AcrR family transcriptional regulator